MTTPRHLITTERLSKAFDISWWCWVGVMALGAFTEVWWPVIAIGIPVAGLGIYIDILRARRKS